LWIWGDIKFAERILRKLDLLVILESFITDIKLSLIG
jgi:hypothetical protein